MRSPRRVIDALVADTRDCRGLANVNGALPGIWIYML
jgi:hypothetical protein